MPPKNSSIGAEGCRYYEWAPADGSEPTRVLSVTSIRKLNGIPFNLACYATLTQIIAQEVGLEVGHFSHTIVDAHIYTGIPEYDHVPGLREQLHREPRPLPRANFRLLGRGAEAFAKRI